MNEQTNEKYEEETVEVDETKHQVLLQELKENQNLLFGIIGGIAAVAVGATIWAVIKAVTNYYTGMLDLWMAVVVGFLVGFAVRIFGKGIDRSFGIVGAALSLLGCLFGNFLALFVFWIGFQKQHFPFLGHSLLNPLIIVKLMKSAFSLEDLLFHVIAVYVGYRFSFRKISEEKLAKLIK